MKGNVIFEMYFCLCLMLILLKKLRGYEILYSFANSIIRVFSTRTISQLIFFNDKIFSILCKDQRQF